MKTMKKNSMVTLPKEIIFMEKINPTVKKRQHPFNCIDVPIPGKIKKGRRNDVQSNTGTVDKSATPSGSIQHDAPIGRTTVFFVKVLSKSYVGNNCIQQHMLFVCEILLRLLETHLCSVSS